MAYTPKIGIQELKKQGLLDEKTFYRLLGEQCNYMAPEAVKTFYMGLVRHLTSELRKNGVVRMPLLGDIALVKQKTTFGWKGKVMGVITGKYLIKFYPAKSWREYFAGKANQDGIEGKLDPRQRILNMDLDHIE